MAPIILWSIFKDLMDQKLTGAKKVTLLKNQFFHARQPREKTFEFCSCCGFIFMTVSLNFEFLFQNNGTFFQKKFWLKSLLMVGTLTGSMWSGF